MRIKLNPADAGSGILGEDGQHLEQGEEHEVSEYFGQMLVASGRASRVKEAPLMSPDQVQNQDPQPINRDPKPAVRGRRAKP